MGSAEPTHHNGGVTHPHGDTRNDEMMELHVRARRTLLGGGFLLFGLVMACEPTSYDVPQQQETGGATATTQGGSGDAGTTVSGAGGSSASSVGGTTSTAGLGGGSGGSTTAQGGQAQGGQAQGGQAQGGQAQGGQAQGGQAQGGQAQGGSAEAGGVAGTTENSLGGTTAQGGATEAGGVTAEAGHTSEGGAENGGSGDAGGSGDVGGATGPEGGTSAEAGSAGTTDSGGEAGATSGEGGASTGIGGTTGVGGSTNPYALHRFVLRDEGMRTLSLVDLDAPENNWYVDVLGEARPGAGDQGRDLQLVGDNRVMVGTPNGFEEYSLVDGTLAHSVENHAGTIAAHRLRNHNTLLTSVTGENIVLTQVDALGEVVGVPLQYPGTYARLVRPTPEGTYLIAYNTMIHEIDEAGTLIRDFTVLDPTISNSPHAWKALRRPDGSTVISEGYNHRLNIFDADGASVRFINAPNSTNPIFFADFQILANGNYVVTNWQAHGTTSGNSGIQLLVFSPAGTLVWSWDQSTDTHFSSLQGIIVLDGLDPTYLHVEDTDGTMVPVIE